MSGERTLGVFHATLVGIGGILGGGLMVLLGAAFNLAGPAAILAFALNGVVAFLTAMSVAEISSTFPQSGGAYNFAKKVLSVRAAFVVGWVTWFAYIVAAVLYALSFAAFTAILIRALYDAAGYAHPAWLDGRNFILLLASGATVLYAVGLVRSTAGGGQWINVVKVVVFALLVAAGVVALVRQPLADIGPELQPFFGGGFTGIAAAMGITFISLQGFEMVAAIAGEVRDPGRSIPRAVFLSLGISFAVYLPFVFLVATAGVDDGGHIVQVSAAHADTVAAIAVSEWLGRAGYWAMVVLIVLATLSAIQANLLTASRIAFAMAHDHTLPSVMERKHPTRGTPIMAIYATTIAVVAIAFMISDLAAAGAASGLIFLLAYALTHVTAYLARRRRGELAVEGAYQTPAFPLVPIVGGAACIGLGVFQAIVVPDAGGVLLIWLALGVLLYFALFKGRSEIADAAAEALDPQLQLLRGKSPLVLLPIANPKTARSMVEVANALAPSQYARVLLLAIVRSEAGDPLARLADAQDAVREALSASYRDGHAPEALITAATQPWGEIRRIADEHRCESLLLGLPATLDATIDREIETLVNEVDCDVALMRAPTDWRIGTAKRVLVPVAGRGDADELRARLLGTLCREHPRELVFLTVLPMTTNDDSIVDMVKSVSHLADMNIPTKPTVEVVRSDDPAAAILAEARRCDLVILGLRQGRSGRRMLGTLNRRIAFEAPCAVMLLARRQQGVGAQLQTIQNVIPWPGRRDEEAS